MAIVAKTLLLLGCALASANEICAKGVGQSDACSVPHGDASAMIQGFTKLSALGVHASQSEKLSAEDSRWTDSVGFLCAGGAMDVPGHTKHSSDTSLADCKALCESSAPCSAIQTDIYKNCALLSGDVSKGVSNAKVSCSVKDAGEPATTEAPPLKEPATTESPATTEAPEPTTTKARATTEAPSPLAGGECSEFCTSFAADMGWPTTCKQAGEQCSGCKGCGGAMIQKSSSLGTLPASEAEPAEAPEPTEASATTEAPSPPAGGECPEFCASFAADMGWPTTCKQAGEQCSGCKGCGGA